MTSGVHGATRQCLAVFLFCGSCVSSFITIPDEFPSFLHSIYGHIPPIRKGTDSRLGVGFRLGEHVDFQILLELGPQKRTSHIGNDIDMKIKRTVEVSNLNIDSTKSTIKLDSKKPEYKTNADSFNAQDSNGKMRNKNSLGSEWLLRWRHGLAKRPQEAISPFEMPASVISQDVEQVKILESANNSKGESNINLNTLKALFKNSSVL